ncbi:MAG: hypothetical protein CV089_14670 [Nitrospira sp. WS110]|nr:hypothetical protein [Nitrospira sp. WS110]
MPNYIAKTHQDWASFLRDEGITDNANFWSPHPKPLLNDLPGNFVFFYSKVPPENRRKVVGWGKVVEYREDTVGHAWEVNGQGNGANSMEEQLERLNSMVPKGEHVDVTSKIGVNIIDDITWLEEPLDVESLGIYVAPSTVRGRSLTSEETNKIWSQYGVETTVPTALIDELARLNRQYTESTPKRRQVISNQIERNFLIVAKLKRLHNSNCQLCKGEFFLKRGGRSRYSEVHHIRELCRGGTNSTDNCLVLCANCHRRMHYGDIQLEDLGGSIRVIVREGQFEITKNVLS